MSKRVLIVTETGAAWPSGHIRALIYKELFAAGGFTVDYASRLVPGLTRLIERSGRIVSRLIDAGFGHAVALVNNRLAQAREAAIVRRARDGYDAIYLQKVSSWPLVAALRRAGSARLVYDLNDGVWLPARAAFAGGHIADILRTVDAVTCDNPYGLEFARQYNSHLFVVPDPPQVELFDQYRAGEVKSGSPIVLGWVGSPTTMFNLYAIWEPLEALFARHPNITLRLVGAGYNARMRPPFEKVRLTARPVYSQIEMIREILRMDIGLFPLFDVQDSLVRGMLKTTLYMSGEVCVVTRPVGQNRDLIIDGVNGVFAGTPGEWVDTLTRLIEDGEERKRIGRAGLQTVREHYTLRHCYDRLLHALGL